MFRRSPSRPATTSARPPLLRALFFALALLLLWVAVQLMPSDWSPASSPPPVITHQETPAEALLAGESQAGESQAGESPVSESSAKASRSDEPMAASAEPTPTKRQTSTSSAMQIGSGTPSLMTPGYLLVLLLLGAGTVAAIWLRRRARGAGTHGTVLMETVAHLPLGPNQQLKLVRCGEALLLLGVTNEQVSLIDRLDPSVLTPTTSGDTKAHSAPPTDTPAANPSALRKTPHFASMLQQYARSAVNLQPTDA